MMVFRGDDLVLGEFTLVLARGNFFCRCGPVACLIINLAFREAPTHAESHIRAASREEGTENVHDDNEWKDCKDDQPDGGRVLADGIDVEKEGEEERDSMSRQCRHDEIVVILEKVWSLNETKDGEA